MEDSDSRRDNWGHKLRQDNVFSAQALSPLLGISSWSCSLWNSSIYAAGLSAKQNREKKISLGPSELIRQKATEWCHVMSVLQKVDTVGRTPPGCRGRRRHCCSGRARSSRWPPTGPGLRAGHAEGRTVPAQEQRNCQHAHPLNPPFPAPNSPCPRTGNCGQEPAGSQGQIRLTGGSVSGGS